MKIMRLLFLFLVSFYLTLGTSRRICQIIYLVQLYNPLLSNFVNCRVHIETLMIEAGSSWSQHIRLAAAHNINLTGKDGTANEHGESDQR